MGGQGGKDSLRGQKKLRIFQANHNIFDWMASWPQVLPKNLIGFSKRGWEKKHVKHKNKQLTQSVRYRGQLS